MKTDINKDKIIQSIRDFYKLDNALKYYLDRHKAQILLDYITNLQQENKQLKEQLEYLRSNEYLNQVKWERNFNEELVKDLQQENKQLKEANNYLQDELYDLRREKTPNYYHSENVNLSRINNNYKSILTELEEWLKEKIKTYKEDLCDGNYLLLCDQCEETLDKIQELKEKYK